MGETPQIVPHTQLQKMYFCSRRECTLTCDLLSVDVVRETGEVREETSARRAGDHLLLGVTAQVLAQLVTALHNRVTA